MGGEGRLQVVCGPMFAGKTEELLRRVRRARLAGASVEVIGHEWDARHGSGTVSSHAGLSLPAHQVPDTAAILDVVADRAPDLVAIDEAQFFGPGLVQVVDGLVRAGITVVVAGLCVTFDGRPFEPLPTFMAIAEDVTKLTAVCALCGRDAAFHRRIGPADAGDAAVPRPALVGGVESYEPRCRRHLWAQS